MTDSTKRSLAPAVVVAAALGAALGAVGMRAVTRDRASVAEAAVAATRMPRTADGKPDFSGIWQALNEAHWDLEAHEARPGAVMQQGVYPFEYTRVPAAPVVALGAAGGVPGSVGVVQGDGVIPYKPETLKVKLENGAHWIDRDPELKCYLPGVPRAMYMPYPFQIVQGPSQIQVTFTFSNAARIIHLGDVEGPPDLTYMGHSLGHWEGDTLVVTVTDFNGKNWFDRAGNYHSEALKVTERFTPITKDAIQYEVTIDDPNVFTRPWTIAMPLYRRLEPNAQLVEYRCTEFVEEFMYGGLRRKPLVKRWESETFIIDVSRKVPEGDKVQDWYRR